MPKSGPTYPRGRRVRKCIPCKATLPDGDWLCPRCHQPTVQATIFNGNPEAERESLMKRVQTEREREQERRSA